MPLTSQADLQNASSWRGSIQPRYLSSLLSDAEKYLAAKPDDREIDLFADGVEVTELPLLLSDEEFRKLQAQLYELILAAAKNGPEPGRKRRVISLTVIPVENRAE